METVKVLVIEEEYANAPMVKAVLAEMKYEQVDLVNSVSDGIMAFKDNDPNMVIIDLMVNGMMTESEVAHALQSINPVPVIFLASYNAMKKAKMIPAPVAAHGQIAPQPFSPLQQELNPNEDKLLNDSFFVRTGTQLVRIPVQSIRWIEVGEHHRCTFKTDKERYELDLKFRDVAGRLPTSRFLRVHANYIVNADYIDYIDTKEYMLHSGDDQIPYSRKYQKMLYDRLTLL